MRVRDETDGPKAWELQAVGRKVDPDPMLEKTLGKPVPWVELLLFGGYLVRSSKSPVVSRVTRNRS